VSLGISAKELEALAATVRKDDAARAALKSGDGGQKTLDALLALGGEVERLTRDYIELVRHRAVTYDCGERTTGEMPELVVKPIRAAVDGKFEGSTSDVEAREKKVREAVPADQRALFDELLAEARHVNRLRDERGLYADCLAIGIARRAMLEVGRRLTERGLLKAADHAVDLTGDEAESLLLHGKGPSLEEVQERVTWRTTKSVSDVPQFLGGEPGGPPDPGILPAPARRAAKAVDAMLNNLFKDTEKTSTKTVVRGTPVNAGTYEGVARLVATASEFHRIEQGDVLVTRSTAPYFNVVLPMLGAIVTDRGGQLCHAAIVAREYGIPAVVGTKRATELIPDGARVRVDGSSGEVTVLGA
jgi:phosphohistidine swiveling domain-containing protein